MEGHILKTVPETKLLGTVVTTDFKWNKKTNFNVKKANKRLELL